MPIETYRLEVREAGESGIEANVYGDDDLIEASTHIRYENYDVDPPEGRDDPPAITEEVTTDVTTLDIQYERDVAGFSIRLLGDREELTTVRVDDDAWNLT